ncbi:hypothetical protein L1887_16355 [Cichorium endivia]|nr:hypothetical protein L1887_16355 [Cichorium endivia]
MIQTDHPPPLPMESELVMLSPTPMHDPPPVSLLPSPHPPVGMVLLARGKSPAGGGCSLPSPWLPRTIPLLHNLLSNHLLLPLVSITRWSPIDIPRKLQLFRSTDDFLMLLCLTIQK